MTHPLTDEMMEDIHGNRPGYSNPFDEDDMRAAYDKGAADRLEQVIEWIRENLMKHDFHEGYAYLYDDCSNAEIEVDLVVKDLKKAMRPQEHNS